jgi:hypothetical protein
MRKREAIHAWMCKLKEWREKQRVVQILSQNLKAKMKYIIEYWRMLNKMEGLNKYGCDKLKK